MTTLKWLQTTLVDDYNLSPDRLSSDARLEELGIDSLGVMELFFKVEDEFKIAVPNDQTELHTIGDVVGHIDRLVADQHGDTAPTSPSAQTRVEIVAGKE